MSSDQVQFIGPCFDADRSTSLTGKSSPSNLPPAPCSVEFDDCCGMLDQKAGAAQDDQ